MCIYVRMYIYTCIISYNIMCVCVCVCVCVYRDTTNCRTLKSPSWIRRCTPVSKVFMRVRRKSLKKIKPLQVPDQPLRTQAYTHSTRAHTHTHAHTHAYTHTGIHALYAHARKHTHTHTCTHTHIHARTHFK